MKKISFFIVFAIFLNIVFVQAQQPDFTGIVICIDPGHSGHESDDRGMPNGFWESEGNLTKGLWLRDLLEGRGCTVYMTRTTNTGDDAVDDWPLSQRAQLAIDNEADLFISIHSNAATGMANYPMTIYNGHTGSPNVPQSQVWAETLWPFYIQNNLTDWTNTDPHAVGDLTLNPGWTYGYGVLYPLSAPGIVGIISEGSMHDFEPEVWRLLNLEWRKQEAWRILYAMEEYFSLGTESMGQITGWVRDSLRIKPDYSRETFDKYEPVDTAIVELLETGETYFVDTSKNGFFYFDSLAPGQYTLRISATKFTTDTVIVDVVANDFTQVHQWQEIDKTIAPEILNINPQDGDTIPCFDPIKITFSMQMDTSSIKNKILFSPEIVATFNWDNLRQNLEIVPVIPYDTSTQYSVTLSSTLMQEWGVELGEDYSFSFTTGNKNRYTLESSFPIDNQTDVSPFLQFRLIFDAPMNNSSLINAVKIISENGDTIKTKSGGIFIIDGKGLYNFEAYEELEYNTNYTLKIEGSVSDFNNIPLYTDIDIPFKTTELPVHYTVLNELESTTAWYLDFDNSNGLDPSSFIYRWTQKKISGEASLLIKYDFIENSGKCKISPSNTLTIQKPDTTIGLWVWGDLSYNELEIEYNDNSTQSLCTLDFAGWKYCQTSGNAQNTTLSSINLIKTSTGVAGGNIYIDALSQPVPLEAGELNNNNLISIYPNPVYGTILTLENLTTEISNYCIYSINGKRLQQGILKNNKQLSTIHLNKKCKSEDILILQIISNNLSYTSKIININK